MTAPRYGRGHRRRTKILLFLTSKIQKIIEVQNLLAAALKDLFDLRMCAGVCRF
jgi:hypothetical protein